MQKYEKIHQRALSAARRFRVAEAELLGVLQEVDREKVYLQLGHGSLFKYAELSLFLSPATASDFIVVARKSVEIPRLKLAVDRGWITVAKARRITPVITKENQLYWIEKAEKLTHRELEKEVAKAQPEATPPDRSRYISDEMIELKFGASEKTVKKFDQAKDLVSQKLQVPANYDSTLSEVLDFYLAENTEVAADASGTVPRSKMKKFILSRDQHRCTFTAPDGRRCETTRWLDVHHIVPRSEGGSDEPENLTTLCSAHHRLLHQDSTL